MEICISHLTKHYGKKTIFEDFSYTFLSGKMYAVVGASGSGKSTLLNIIGLLDDFSSGHIYYDGDEISSHCRKTIFYLRNIVSYLFQNYALIETESVKNNLLIALKHVKSSHKDDLIKESLKKVNLVGYENEKVYSLSGGEQQRVAMARLYLKPSEVILADEPTGNLDENNKKRIIESLKSFANEGKIVIIATHDYSIVKVCDEIIEL